MNITDDFDRRCEFDERRLGEEDILGGAADGIDLTVFETEGFGDAVGVSSLEQARNVVINVHGLTAEGDDGTDGKLIDGADS